MRKESYRPIFAFILSALMSLSAEGLPTAVAQETDEVMETDDGGEAEEKEEETERQIEVTSEYQDANGMAYQWYGYNDGTAEIYGFRTDRNNPVVEIPGEISGYVVTDLTGSLSYTSIESLTIPESVTTFGTCTFQEDKIKVLNYNAVDARCEESFFTTPFGYSEVEEFHIGQKVQVIGDYTFYKAVFDQEKVELRVPTIGKYAFDGATFQTLELTEDVEEIYGMAFMKADIQELIYNCPAADLIHADSLTTSPFYDSIIHELTLDSSMNVIPDYLFANACFEMKEFVVDREWIGRMAFYGVWKCSMEDRYVEKLIITEDVTHIGAEAFGYNNIKNLEFNADVETDSISTVTGIFYMSNIYGLTVNDQVTQLPDYCFANATMCFTEYDMTTPQIGDDCFYDAWTSDSTSDYPVKLTISDSVTMLGKNAFQYCDISELYFEANVQTMADSTSTGPFYMAKISSLSIGDQVEEIPDYLFSNADFMKKVDLSLDVPIGNYAFYSSWTYHEGFGTLTIGEHVTSMGKGAFYHRSIDNLCYNAVSAVNANELVGEAAFYNCTIGAFTLGESVEVLDAGTFCGIKLTQDTLVIPDGVRSVGSYCFYDSTLTKDGFRVNHLMIGRGVEVLNPYAFSELKFETIHVEAIEAGSNYESDISGSAVVYLPKCDKLYIHLNSDFYEFFSHYAGEVEALCEDYLLPSVGETYFDDQLHQYVTPHYETCSVCGYRITTYDYEDGGDPEPEPEEESEPEEEQHPEDESEQEEEKKTEPTPDPGTNGGNVIYPNPESVPDMDVEQEPEHNESEKEKQEPMPTPDDKPKSETKTGLGQPDAVSEVEDQKIPKDHVDVEPEHKDRSNPVKPAETTDGKQDGQDSEQTSRDEEISVTKPQIVKTEPLIETGQEEQEHKKNPLFPVLPLTVSILAGLGGSGVVYFWFWRRRRVTGTVSNVDGKAVKGMLVTLDDRETFTNDAGAFVIRGMRRGNHALCVTDDEDGRVLLDMNICAEGKEDEEIFTVLRNSCVRVDTHKEGKTYMVFPTIVGK